MNYCYYRPSDNIKAVFLIIASVCICYSNTLGVGFFYDDLSNIVRNESLKTPAGFEDIIFGERPIGMLTFALNYRWGGLNPAGYHLFNIFVHILNCILAYFFLLRVFNPVEKQGTTILPPKKTALLAVLLFAVHPIQTQAVTYIVQRTEILASTFMLTALLLFAYAATSSGSLTRKTGLFLTIPLYFLGYFTKEIAITLPILLLAYDFFFLSNGSLKKLLQRSPLHLTQFASCIIFTVNKLTAFQQTKGGSAGFVLKSITSGEYLLTQSHVIWTYIRLFFFPFNQNLDYDYPLSRSLLEPNTFFSILTLLTTFLALFLLIRKNVLGIGQSALLFFIFWFFVILSPTTSFIPILDVIYEHRVYLPSLGFFAVASMLVNALAKKIKNSYSLNTPGLCEKFLTLFIVLLFSTLTVARNQVWSDPIALWKDTVLKSPKKARPFNNLGNAYINSSNYDEAIFWLKKSIEADPMYMESHFNIGLSYIKKGDLLQAIPYMEEVVRINDILKTGHFGVSYNKKMDLMAHTNLGNLYNVKGEYVKAIRHFIFSLSIDPTNTSTLFNLGITYRKTRNNNDAIKTFEKILDIDNTDQGARRNLLELKSSL